MDIENEIKELKRQVAMLSQGVVKQNFQGGRQTNMPVVIAPSYEVLSRMGAGLTPPCFGFVTNQKVTKEDYNYDQNNVRVEPWTKDIQGWAARYFVLTYPPTPPIFKFRQPTQGEHGVTNADYGVTGIYQPSAGLAGSMVYFDQDIPYSESMFSVGTPSGNNLWRIDEIQTYDRGGQKYVKSIKVGYQNGIKMDKLYWMEVNLLGPFGRAIDDRYRTVAELLIESGFGGLTNENIMAKQLKLFGTSFDPIFLLPVYDPMEDNEKQ